MNFQVTITSNKKIQNMKYKEIFTFLFLTINNQISGLNSQF